MNDPKIDWPAVWRECDRRLPSMDQLAPWHMVTVQEVVDEQLQNSTAQVREYTKAEERKEPEPHA